MEPGAALLPDGGELLAAGGSCETASKLRLGLEEVASGLRRPLYVLSPPSDPRLFVLEQRGRILIHKEGSLRPEPFLDLSDRLTDGANEQGLLGMAFHPNYAKNGRFFVNYSEARTGATVVAEYRVDPSKPDRALREERRVLRVDQPYSNHNAGQLAFGPRDGFLYVGLGDGGAGGDPKGNGQDASTLLGSMLRLDVDSSASGYAVPADNPTARLRAFGGSDPRPEVWAMGLRNPWRYSFDPLTGDLYIGDVGQNAFEEIHWQPGNSPGGENYGWNTFEAAACYSRRAGCDLPGRTEPVYVEKAQRPCSSITGGYVYRGKDLPALQGHYFFADYCHNTVRSFVVRDGAATGHCDWTSQLDPLGGALAGIASFGLDARGELYIVTHRSGRIFRVVAAGEGPG